MDSLTPEVAAFQVEDSIDLREILCDDIEKIIKPFEHQITGGNILWLENKYEIVLCSIIARDYWAVEFFDYKEFRAA
jgi:hypothetical protein